MALANIGLGGVLTFDDKQAIAGMKAAGAQSDKFAGQFSGIMNAVNKVGGGMAALGGAARSAGAAMLPATAAFGLGMHTAGAFEHQMQAVKAVAKATDEEMVSLTNTAKNFGRESSHGPIKAAEGLETLARAGFKPTTAMAALAATMNMAAAEGMDLEKATNILTKTYSGLSMGSNDPRTQEETFNRIADVLTVASAKSTTSISALGEGFRYSIGEARELGVEVETLAALLAVSADATLDNTVAGTSFTQAFVKLIKPSVQGQEMLDQMGVKFKFFKNGAVDVIDVLKQVHERIDSFGNRVDRTRALTELFGVRGQKTFSAVSAAIDSGKLDEVMAALDPEKVKGAAKEMADTRLDSFFGQLQMISASFESLNIETFGEFLKPFTESTKVATKVINGLVEILMELKSETGLTADTAEKHGDTMVAVARGIQEGIDIVIDAYQRLRTTVVDLITEITGDSSEESIQSFSKMATVLFVVAAAVAPVLLAVGTLVFVITSVLGPAFGAIGTMIGALFSWPVLAAVAIVVGGFWLIRDEGETVQQTFTRIVDGIVEGFDWVKKNAIEPFLEGFLSVDHVVDDLGLAFDDFCWSVKNDFNDLVSAFKQSTKELEPLFKGVFKLLGFLSAGITIVFGHMLDGIKETMTDAKNIIISVLESAINLIKNISWGLGKMADVAGMDFGKAMMEFGAGTFQISGSKDERGVKLPTEPEKLALAARRKEDMSFGLAEVDQHAQVEAIAAAMKGALPGEINVDSKVCVDGKTIARATGKHKQELSERAGFKATPWARRARAEHGSVPATGGD